MTETRKHARFVDDKNVRIDISQVISAGKVKDFAINVAILRKNTLYDVFRVDTAHGYLHVQKFWISDKPEKLQDKRKKDYKGDFGYWKNKMMKEYKDYVKIYRKSRRWEQ